MSTREELTTAISAAQAKLTDAKDALAAFEAKAENNVFESIDKAVSKVEGMLEHRAHQDCEGSHNCGQDEYTQEFMVAGVKYIGTLKVEYNRHDKTYYYVESSDFSYAPA
jgi:hypothetical protein